MRQEWTLGWQRARQSRPDEPDSLDEAQRQILEAGGAGPGASCPSGPACPSCESCPLRPCFLHPMRPVRPVVSPRNQRVGELSAASQDGSRTNHLHAEEGGDVRVTGHFEHQLGAVAGDATLVHLPVCGAAQSGGATVRLHPVHPQVVGDGARTATSAARSPARDAMPRTWRSAPRGWSAASRCQQPGDALGSTEVTPRRLTGHPLHDKVASGLPWK